MQFRVQLGDISKIKTDAIIVNLFEGVKKPEGATGAIDKALNGAISKLISSGEIKGTLNEVTLIHSLGKIPAERIIVAGLGKKDEFNQDKIRQITSASLQKARSIGAKKVATILHGAGIGKLDISDSVQGITEGALLGLYEFKKYFSKNKDKSGITELILVERESSKLGSVKKGVQKGQIIANAVNMARDLVNEPPNTLTPTELANRAKTLAKEVGLKCKILGVKEIKKLKMGGLLGVAKGSVEEPRFIILEYKGVSSKETPIGLVGKGVTFDSGGISIKPAADMDHMKADMAGAAAVISAMGAIAQLKPKINVTALVPTTENLPGGKAFKPADILVNMDGKTIEIVNTDAEGRLILADALSYALRLKLQPVVDAATLTGACAVAIGPFSVGVFTNKQEIADEILQAAGQVGERFWQLPMFPEYAELDKSKIADIRNTGTGREGGAITAAKFLEFFIEDTPWVHLDIAPTYYVTSPRPYQPFGATGTSVRTFIQFVLNRAK